MVFPSNSCTFIGSLCCRQGSEGVVVGGKESDMYPFWDGRVPQSCIVTIQNGVLRARSPESFMSLPEAPDPG